VNCKYINLLIISLIVSFVLSSCGFNNQIDNQQNTSIVSSSIYEDETADTNSLLGLWTHSPDDPTKAKWKIKFYSDATYVETFTNSKNSFSYTGTYSLNDNYLTRKRDEGQLSAGTSSLKIEFSRDNKSFTMHMSNGTKTIFNKTD